MSQFDFYEACERGNVDEVKVLLQNKEINPAGENGRGTGSITSDEIIHKHFTVPLQRAATK